MARIIHMIYHAGSVDSYYDLLLRFKRIYAKGGKQRQKYTYPALIFALIRLSQEVNFREVNGYASK